MSNQNDPRGEYTRVCPYCGDSFIADHLSRFYCPEKNGIKNQCKHRQKRIMDKLRKEGGILPVHKKNPIEVVFKDKDLPSNDIDKIVDVASKKGTTEVKININDGNNDISFKLKNKRLIDRKAINILRKNDISTIIH